MTASPFTSRRKAPRFIINAWSDVPVGIVKAEQCGAIGLAECLRSLDSGRNALLSVVPEMPSATFKQFAAVTRHRPAVVLIGDDDGLDRGPFGWAVSRRAIKWAASILLHAAGGEREHYQGAIDTAQVVHRVLIVEASRATVGAWTDMIQSASHRPAVLTILPRGGVHPVSPARELMQ